MGPKEEPRLFGHPMRHVWRGVVRFKVRAWGGRLQRSRQLRTNDYQISLVPSPQPQGR